MRNTIFLMMLIPVVAQASTLYKCVNPNGVVTFTNQKVSENCVALTPSKEAIDRFRKSIKVGDMSALGLVIEVKKPLVLIQPDKGENRWHRIDDLIPNQTKSKE
jgi:hypothetical protein